MNIANAERTGQDARILVVEDEPILQTLIQTILQGEGYAVQTAGSGDEALERWRQNQGQFDLLMTDMVLPDGFSGSGIAEQLHSEHPGLKVVYASGFSVGHICAPGLELVEGWNFLQKPYSTQNLTKTVRRCLQGVPEEDGYLNTA